MEKHFEIVKVTWIDAQRMELGVQHQEDISDLQPIPCDIVGFKIHEDKERIVIAQEKWDDLQGFKYVHVIPKISITRVIKLEARKE